MEQLALQLAFEAGKWAGEVEMEERIERQVCCTSLGEYGYCQNTGMPFFPANLENIQSTITLRSQKWRDSVKKQVSEYMEKANKFLEL